MGAAKTARRITPPGLQLRFSFRVGFVVSLGLLSATLPGTARAQSASDGGAPASESDYPVVDLPAGTCTSSSCHSAVTVDSAHKAKDVTCVKCHSNVTDNKKPHKGTLDKLAAPEMCGQSKCHGEAVKNQAAGAHKDSMCESCHDALHGDFKPRNYGNCGECHEDQAKAFEASVHAKASHDERPVACDDCHGDLHAPKAKADPLAPMSKILQVSTCGECHDKEYVRAYRTSVHGQGVVKSGLSVAPSCVDCHGSHGMTKVKDSASMVSNANITDTCGKCHTFIVARWKESAHGRKWLEEQQIKKGEKHKSDGPQSKTSEDHPREAPVCTNCHSGHRTFDPTIYGNNLPMVDRCAECHKKHAESYRDSFHGKAARLGYGPAAACASCHTPHEMLPTDNPRASVNPKNLTRTCGQCHQPINDSFVKFDSHMDARNASRNRGIHYVWLFMTALLMGVLSFFALHTLLWLQRALVALSRKELPHARPGDRWVRRFKPVHIWIHVTIVVTFLLLSATGLPLKFSGVEWARPFEAIFGGLRAARWLHRLAGVFTFGYGGVFLVYLIREIVIRGRTELLWGWQSMMPNKKDLIDLFANLRWFLYLGPPPKLDRWAYWEKFDFFAVFWGIPMIGLSGLALWIPLTVTQHLPGWVLNVAYLIHSDEALLATGFIFYFHLFHTHLRPEAFPLDTVVFLGGMPLERFQAERPAEWARIEKSGELAKYLMPAPSQQEISRARRFGFAALSIGVILGTFLIFSGISTFLR